MQLGSFDSIKSCDSEYPLIVNWSMKISYMSFFALKLDARGKLTWFFRSSIFYFFFLTFSYGITLPTVKFVTFSWRLLRDTRFIEGTKEEIFTRWKLSRTTFTSQMWNIYFGYLSVVSLSTCQSWNADATGQFIQ